MTCFAVSTEDHAVACLVYGYQQTIIKDLFVAFFNRQDIVKQEDIDIIGELLDDYSINWGNHSIFAQEGYCLLLLYLMMDFMYSNIVILFYISIRSEYAENIFSKCSMLFK